MISIDEKKRLIKQKKDEVPPHVLEMGLNMLFIEPKEIIDRIEEGKQIELIKLDNLENSKADTVLIDIRDMPYSSELDTIASNKSIKPELGVIVYDIILEEYQVYLHRIYQTDAIVFPLKPLNEKTAEKIIFIANSMGILPIPFIESLDELSKIKEMSFVDVLATNESDMDTDKLLLSIDLEKEIVRCLKRQ
ncbi:hypothetical protein [Hippea sp. KM1]|uniref:hypothetical protein n=1 Tax=Hippea sp. KM1 TaxID=944481 RepID=UPI00046CEC98|nr:hypothetical protein [Hippea sp. KM1]